MIFLKNLFTILSLGCIGVATYEIFMVREFSKFDLGILALLFMILTCLADAYIPKGPKSG